MFQNLRQGTPLYVLYKSPIRLEIGEVVSVSAPQPEFGATFTAGMQYQPQQMIVDIAVKAGEDTVNLKKIPADQNIIDFNNMVISESQDAIFREVKLIHKKSMDAISEESIAQNKQTMADCEKIMSELSPSYKQDTEQRKEMDAFREELSSVNTRMGNIEALLTKIAKSSKSKED